MARTLRVCPAFQLAIPQLGRCPEAFGGLDARDAPFACGIGPAVRVAILNPEPLGSPKPFALLWVQPDHQLLIDLVELPVPMSGAVIHAGHKLSRRLLGALLVIRAIPFRPCVRCCEDGKDQRQGKGQPRSFCRNGGALPQKPRVIVGYLKASCGRSAAPVRGAARMPSSDPDWART